MAKGSGLKSNLAVLYKNYGGWKELATSSYFLVSIVLSAGCWRLIMNGRWADLAVSILPTLAGFSVAAYALFFAVLDERAREALRAPAETLGNRSPLLMLASSVSHAVIVQVFSLLVALIYIARPFPVCPMWEQAGMIANIAVGLLGTTAFVYGIALVVASVLSIFRVLEIRTRV